MKLVESYIICEDGNIFSDGKLLSRGERRYLAKTTTNPELLEKLSHDKNIFVRGEVAENSLTPTNILKKLSRDKDWEVRCSIVFNSLTPVNILERLSQDEDLCVRWWAYGSLKRKKTLYKGSLM